MDEEFSKAADRPDTNTTRSRPPKGRGLHAAAFSVTVGLIGLAFASTSAGVAVEDESLPCTEWVADEPRWVPLTPGTERPGNWIVNYTRY